MREWQVVAFVVFAVAGLTGRAAGQQSVEADVLLKGGTIYDGTGGEPVVGDVAIRGEKIVAVGAVNVGRADLVIDCRGLSVAPGFIDLHNHSDRQIVDPDTRANVNFLTQGCTTVVTGNCGSGPVDVAAYYQKIDAAGAGTNVAHLLPQGSLRGEVVGSADRPPRDDELDEMRRLAANAMHEGAWGMSTGLIYVPSSYAQTDELVEIAKVVADGGGIYASHIRNEGIELLVAVNEALDIGRRAGLPVHVSHFKSSGREAWGLVRRAAEMIEQARAAGQPVTADQYPYIASSTSLEATVIPTWARAGGQKELLKRLDDPATSDRIRSYMADRLAKRDGGAVLRIARYGKRPEWAGRSIAEIAAAEQMEPLQLALDITRNGGAAIVNFSMAEDDVRHIMQIPWVATASDGRAYVPGPDRPHPRSYGTFPRKIGYYAIGEEVLPLAQAIRSASGLPADILGLCDRGYVKADAFADVVVFDPGAFRDEATFEEPHRYSSGVKFVFVNGRPAVFEGHPTGALAGRALRHAATTAGGQEGKQED
ncbi:MAG TPA: D-aminoacylase [Planctomycetaceae bacterium]|nr:D-aminoacylase [Planctomycetaceae bacterium]